MWRTFSADVLSNADCTRRFSLSMVIIFGTYGTSQRNAPNIITFRISALRRDMPLMITKQQMFYESFKAVDGKTKKKRKGRLKTKGWHLVKPMHCPSALYCPTAILAAVPRRTPAPPLYLPALLAPCQDTQKILTSITNEGYVKPPRARCRDSATIIPRLATHVHYKRRQCVLSKQRLLVGQGPNTTLHTTTAI